MSPRDNAKISFSSEFKNFFEIRKIVRREKFSFFFFNFFFFLINPRDSDKFSCAFEFVIDNEGARENREAIIEAYIGAKLCRCDFDDCTRAHSPYLPFSPRSKDPEDSA